MSDERRVRDYFHRTADEFDDIYGGSDRKLMRWLNHRLRRDMYHRFDVVMDEMGDLKGRSVLDIGCGSGRFAHACARRGADRVLGIDFAPNMIEIADRIAGEMGVMDTCRFVVDDFMSMELQEKSFDISLAIGLFDYIRDPGPVLAKINHVTRAKVYSTFPVKWVWRTPLRKLRLALAGCPVYFFTESDLGRLFRPPATTDWRILYRRQIYVVESVPA